MFFRYRRRFSLFTFLMFLIGIKTLKKERMSDEEREEYRMKRKLFRRKMREACAVWDEDSDATTSADTETK